MSLPPFGSDNYAATHPEVLAAIADANDGYAVAYGDDPWTTRLDEVVQELFGTGATAFPVLNGTGANVIGLMATAPRWAGVVASDVAHAHTDENGAPERVGGLKLLTRPVTDGRLTVADVEAWAGDLGDVHSAQPAVLTLTQATELGTVYRVAELRALTEVLDRHPGVWVLTDEIYAELNFQPFTRFTDAAPGLQDRTLTVNGVSKAWSMTGWRIGWGIGPAALIKAMAAVQGQVTSGACSIAQAAALAALTGDQAGLAIRREELRTRRDRVVAALQAVPGFDCPSPDGAFYVFPRITGAMAATGHATDADFCRWLLLDHGVALVPGRAFGLPGHLRLSFAYSDADLAKGLSRIASAVGAR